MRILVARNDDTYTEYKKYPKNIHEYIVIDESPTKQYILVEDNHNIRKWIDIKKDYVILEVLQEINNEKLTENNYDSLNLHED